jgi:hypothetical protein
MSLEQKAEDLNVQLELELGHLTEKFNRDVNEAGNKYGLDLVTEISIAIASKEGS